MVLPLIVMPDPAVAIDATLPHETAPPAVVVRMVEFPPGLSSRSAVTLVTCALAKEASNMSEKRSFNRILIFNYECEIL